MCERCSMWRAQDAAPLGFRGVRQGCSHTPPPPLLFYFFISKEFSYICTLLQALHVHALYISDNLYYDRANKYIQILSLIYMELTITGTRARRLFDLLHGDHQKRIFTLNMPASSIISFIKSSASSSVIPSRCCCGWSFSRMYSTYIGK